MFSSTRQTVTVKCRVCPTRLGSMQKGEEAHFYCEDCRHTCWFNEKAELIKMTRGNYDKNKCSCNGCQI